MTPISSLVFFLNGCFLCFFYVWCSQHASTNTRHKRQERAHRERFWLKVMEAVAALAAVQRIQVG